MSAETMQGCFHCGEAIPPGVRIYARVKDAQAPVCCEGCRAVAELIGGMGLEDYYRFRSETPAPPAVEQDHWQAYEQAELIGQYTRPEKHAGRSAALLIEGMRCAACAWLIDRALSRETGIRELSVNAATQRAHIVWSEGDLQFADVLRKIAALGYKPVPVSADALHQVTQRERRAALKRLAISGLGMMQVMMFSAALYVGGRDMEAVFSDYLRVVSLLLATPVLLYAGWPFFRGAANALRMRDVNMDVPVSLALLLAYGASIFNTVAHRGETYFDSVTMFIFFLTLGRFIEMLVRHRTRDVTEALAGVLPRVAHRVKGATLKDIPVQQLIAGDEILVRLGETVPADGVILSGETSCEEALLTGESKPVARQPGDTLIAGTLNVGAPVRMRVTAVGDATVLSGMLALLDRAQADKPKLARSADRAASWFLRRVLIVTVAVGAAWLWFDPARAFDAVLAVLVVTCPCALSLATPAVIAAATAALARKGLLVTHADAIEALAGINHAIFDKTGTLTQGRLSVRHCRRFGNASESRCFAVAATLERAAEHPIGRAFKAYDTENLVAQDARVTPGAGIEARIDGRLFRIGTASFVAQLSGHTLSPCMQRSAEVFLGGERGLMAGFKLSDSLRAGSAETVGLLEQLGVHCQILSGDALPTVETIAAQTGIDLYQGRLTPGEKLQHLQKLTRAGNRIAVIGDGVNDAPMLRAAQVSIAMSSGSAIAQASADAVLIAPTLLALPAAIEIARRAQVIVRQNLSWALVYNLCALPLAALGLIPPWLAAIGMSLSSVIVVLNALRLLPRKAPALPETRYIAAKIAAAAA